MRSKWTSALEGLKAVDTSDSPFVQTYTTGIPLPANFYLSDRTTYLGTTPHIQVPFERAVEYRDIGGFFYIDNASGDPLRRPSGENRKQVTGTSVYDEFAAAGVRIQTNDLTNEFVERRAATKLMMRSLDVVRPITHSGSSACGRLITRSARRPARLHLSLGQCTTGPAT